MANEKSDISDIVKKCKILLLDIEGTTTSIRFVKDKLYPYAEANVKAFLDSEWESENVKEVVVALRKLALEDEENKVDGVVAIPGEDASKEDQIEGLVSNVKWHMSSDRKVGPLKQLQGLIWRKGYDKGDIKGHVYDDVPPALELWRSVEGQKVYIYSSGSVQAQKLLFRLSSAGDMLKLIDGHFDTAVGAKQEAASYTTIAEKIGCKPEDILFLTDTAREAEAARSAGVQAALVSREGNAPLNEATANSFPVLYSFAELAATNKRKPDAQEEQPAKILKTDVEADVKTSFEKEVKNHADGAPQAEPEKMEVDEEVPTKTDAPIVNATEEVVKKSEIIVEEITDSNEIVGLPICVAEPVIDESPDKTENNKTEPIENEVVNSVSESKENNEHENDKVAPVGENLPAVTTEIKDITNEKEGLTDVVEMVDDLVPVVEEPPTQDMEDLENVGEVLAKECDEILSKVQNVTNLNNIPLKPVLNSIAEEVMETENTDSNDIVDGILDTELDFEMKQCADIDINSIQEISEPKETTEENKNEIQEVMNNKANVVADVAEKETVALEKIDENGTPRENVNKIDNTEESGETINTVKETKENSPTEDTTKKIISADNKTEESSSKEEKLLEVPATEAKTVEDKPVEEKNEEIKSTDDKIKANSHKEAPVVESSITEEKMEESTDKQNVSSTPAEEKIEQTTVTEEKSADSSATEKKAEESVSTEENVKASCPAGEQVKGPSTTNKKVEEESVSKNTDDDSKPQEVTESNTVQISETSAPTESKMEDTKIVADEDITKVEIKKDEDKMETDENTPKTEDFIPETEGTNTENRLEAQENNIQCDKSDESKDMDTDTPSEPLPEKVIHPEAITETPSEPLTKTPPETATETPSEPSTETPSEKPTETPSEQPTETPSEKPTETPSEEPTDTPSQKPTETESSMEVEQTETPAETKENDKVASDSVDVEVKSEDTEISKLNGNTTNGDTEMVSLNGDSNKEEELKSRLSMGNGQEVVNGANGDSSDAKKATENNEDDVKEIPDVKAKTVAIDEPRNDPIEQPMEA